MWKDYALGAWRLRLNRVDDVKVLEMLMGLIGGLARYLSSGAILIASTCSVLMCLHVGVEVLSRSFFGRPLVGTIEAVSFFYMIIVSFLPLAFVQLQRAHISVDVLANVLPPMALRLVDLLANIVTLIVVSIVSWAAFTMALRQTGFEESTRAGMYSLPIWPSRWVVVAGFAIMALVLAVQIYATLMGKRSRLYDSFGDVAKSGGTHNELEFDK